MSTTLMMLNCLTMALMELTDIMDNLVGYPEVGTTLMRSNCLTVALIEIIEIINTLVEYPESTTLMRSNCLTVALMEITDTMDNLVGYPEVGRTLMGSNKLTYTEVLIGNQMTFEELPQY